MKERILTYLSGLSSREKNILLFFGCAVALFFATALFFIFDGMVEIRKEEIREKRELMEKIDQYKGAFRRARDKEASMLLAIQTNETNLNSHLNNVREAFGVEISTIKELKPEKKGEFQKEMIEVGIRAIDMSTLMTMLYGLENKARFVFIDALSIKKRFDGKNYEVTLVLATLKEAAEK
ncbi:MAG TPA: GspMb/PilO family protein [bacterium]|nr:GspMb/PilO family protein [bacterium]